MDFLYHVVLQNGTVITNLPDSLYAEMDNCTAKTKCEICSVRGVLKRHKKAPLNGGFAYLCSYDSELTNNNFKLCFEVFISLVSCLEDSLKRAVRPSIEEVRSIRHNVYGQLSHIQDDLKTLISFDDIPSKDWPEIVSNATNSIVTNAEASSKAILRTIKRTAISLAEFDAYDLISSSNPPSIYPHTIHKVVKLSIQPYIFDFWDHNVGVQIGECYEKVSIDYELVNLALGHFWNNAVKYVKPGTSITITFSPAASYDGINVTINMVSLFIRKDEKEAIFEKGVSGEEAKRTKLCGHGMGMFFIRECIHKCFGQFTITPGETKHIFKGKEYASNSFKFYFPMG